MGQNLSIPVSVTIDGDQLKVRVHTDEINERIEDAEDLKNYRLITMNLVQAFGAGRTDEEGYIFVPDGSGAVINFNNGKTSTTVYNSKVYGNDLAVSKHTLKKHGNRYISLFWA